MTFRKTNKADLAKTLEAHCDEIQFLTGDRHTETAYIIDAMAYLQALNETHFNTFDDLGYRVLQRMGMLMTGELAVTSVTLVFDRYDNPDSIKQMERARLEAGETTPTYVIQGSNKVPNYRNFLKSYKNKATLVEFLCNYIMLNGPAMLEDGQSIILAGGLKDGKDVKVVQHSGVTDSPELASTHGADTRMVLHTISLADKYSRIIVQCDDTDVLVLLIHYCGKGMFGNSSVYMHAGHASKDTNHQRFIPVSSETAKIGEEVSHCLPASHA